MRMYMVEYEYYGRVSKEPFTEAGLRMLVDRPMTRVYGVENYTPVIRYETKPDCERCTYDEYVPHGNCRCGANKPHCTSDYCY